MMIHSHLINYFLSWNRRFRQHRTSLALLLEKHNLVEKSLISFAKVDGEMSSRTYCDEIEDTTVLME